MIERSADSGKGGGAMSYFRGLNWNVLYVVIAQMLVMTTTNIHVILSGLVGAVLAPVPWLATLAITVQLIAVMLTTLPASLLMARFGRRPIFLAGGIATIIAGIGQGMAVIWQNFYRTRVWLSFLDYFGNVFCTVSFSVSGPNDRLLLTVPYGMIKQAPP